jgi:tetrahydromethanopterin S-methyltransferase subunit B
MKNLFIALLVVGLLAAFTVPALAQLDQEPDICDVGFDVNVEKNKEINIEKNVEKNFEFTLELGIEIIGFPQWAEVEAFKCDHNEGNEVSVSELGGTNNISDSFNEFTGIAQINQASGLLNNQGNIMAAGLTDKSGDTNTFGLSMVEAAVEKANMGNELTVDEMYNSDNIANSFNSFTGLAQINQASGILNNQNNVVVIGTNLNTTGLVAENDTFLTMQNAGNEVAVNEMSPTANIADSFNQYTGVAQINQAPGALNNQTNIISVAFAGRNYP